VIFFHIFSKLLLVYMHGIGTRHTEQRHANTGLLLSAAAAASGAGIAVTDGLPLQPESGP
jgi:hypothetical protein